MENAGREVSGAKQAAEQVAGELERTGRERVRTRVELL
jgi:hypothetical protein